MADAPKPIIYQQSRRYVLSTMGGFLLLASMKAFLFRFDHPDGFYEIMGCAVAAFMSLLFFFPPSVRLTPNAIVANTFGYVWMRLPWEAVTSIEMFRTPVVKYPNGRQTGGRRALGFRIDSKFRDQVRPQSGSYGYDAVLPSMWDFSIDRVAEQCGDFWRARGGSGEVINRLEHYETSQLILTS